MVRERDVELSLSVQARRVSRSETLYTIPILTSNHWKGRFIPFGLTRSKENVRKKDTYWHRAKQYIFSTPCF